uniref:exopolygalacturonase-like n=1 Tax=Erigeron canadensis TaxID=72917 RepID=UPI001CB8B057|nr:exopolygalacturonase-like [Erigeron canadensis]
MIGNPKYKAQKEVKTSLKMGKKSYIQRAICSLFLMASITMNHSAVIDIKAKGAKADGKTDDGPVLMAAWKEACNGPPPSSLVIPAGTYLVLPPIMLAGPCKGPIEIKATGATIKAPPELAKFKENRWITIRDVDKLTWTGGNLDGQGQAVWKGNQCAKTASCALPPNIGFTRINNSLVKDLTSTNSKFFHINILGCDNTNFDHITVNAPGDSVNTDGIHIGRLNNLNITNSVIKTGDDCISFGDGSKNVRVEKVTCGPGHGISIGSLGRYKDELPVQGIWVKNCTIIGTQNGVRIKSWPNGTPGTASDMHFEDIIMDKVMNPVIIDHQYCPSGHCDKGPTKVKMSNISFRKIKGTSATKVAVKLICSQGFCDNVEVGDINLVFQGAGGGATSECTNVKPKVVGQVVPPVCTSAPKSKI